MHCNHIGNHKNYNRCLYRKTVINLNYYKRILYEEKYSTKKEIWICNKQVHTIFCTAIFLFIFYPFFLSLQAYTCYFILLICPYKYITCWKYISSINIFMHIGTNFMFSLFYTTGNKCGTFEDADYVPFTNNTEFLPM